MEYLNFQFNKKNMNNIFFILMGIFLVLSIPSSIIGTGVVNSTIVLFDLLFLLYLLLNIKNFEFNKKELKFLYVLILILILNCLFSSNLEYSLLRSLSILKITIFILGSVFIIIHNTKIHKYFLLCLFISVIFVSSDSFYQFIFTKDIFGFEKAPEVLGGRLTGPFKEEYIPGSFISKLTFLSLIYLLTFKIKNFFKFLTLAFLLAITILTKERMASLMLIFSSSFYLMFYSKNIKRNFIILIISLLTIFSIIYSNKNFNNRFIKTTLSQMGLSDYTTSHNKGGSIFDSDYGAHFLTGIEIFKDNFLFGSGLKTFRSNCGLKKYESIKSTSVDNRCTTHPHNFYLEVLSETGIIGFAFFIYLIFILLKSLFYINDRELRILSFSILILLFWPIKTSGSIFSSWNGFLYALNVIYLLYFTKSCLIFKKKK